MSLKEKESKSYGLPVINPQAPLIVDNHPVIISTMPPEPIDVQQLITRMKLKLSPPRASNTPLRQSTMRSEIDSLKQKIQLLEGDRQRLTQQVAKHQSTPQPVTEQQHHQLQNDYRALKQNYDELARRYHEGEQAFFHLKARCEYLQAELKKALDQPLVAPALVTFNPARLQQELADLRTENSSLLARLASKDGELKLVSGQLKVSSDELSLLKAAQSPKNSYSFDLKQNRRTTELPNFYDPARLTSDLARISEESCQHRLKTQNQRLVQEIEQFRQQYNRATDENLRLKNELVMLKSDLIKRESYKMECESLVRQLSTEKQGHQLLMTELQRLKNQLIAVNELLEQERKDRDQRTELERKGVANNSYRYSEVSAAQPQALGRQELDRLKHSLQAANLDKEGLERTVRDLNLQLTFERSKGLRLQSELSKSEEELQKLKSMANSSHRTSRNQSTQKKYGLTRPEDSREIEDHSEIIRLREQLQFLHANRLRQDCEFKRVQEQLRRTKLEMSMEHSQDSLLKKQLDLSVREVRNLSELAKQNTGELMQKILLLYTEKQQLQKKSQCQQFQLTKLYEVLQTRREELESCYRTIEGLRKGINPPLQQSELDELLRTRRERSF